MHYCPIPDNEEDIENKSMEIVEKVIVTSSCK